MTKPEKVARRNPKEICAQNRKSGLTKHKQEAGHVHILGDGVQARQQEAEEPADHLLQLARALQRPFRRVLPLVQGRGDVLRRGAQSHRPQEDEGDLRDYAGQGPVRGLAGRGWIVGEGAPPRPGVNMRHGRPPAAKNHLTEL